MSKFRVTPTAPEPTKEESQLARQFEQDLERYLIGIGFDQAIDPYETTGIKVDKDGTVRAMTREEIDEALKAQYRSPPPELWFVPDEK